MPLPPLTITSESYPRKRVDAAAAQYGPSTETPRWPPDGGRAETVSYSFRVQAPLLVTTTLSVSGSRLLLDVTVNGCHWSRETLGTLTKSVLVGLYLRPATRITAGGVS
jgi:hypothetical protein